MGIRLTLKATDWQNGDQPIEIDAPSIELVDPSGVRMPQIGRVEGPLDIYPRASDINFFSGNESSETFYYLFLTPETYSGGTLKLGEQRSIPIPKPMPAKLPETNEGLDVRILNSQFLDQIETTQTFRTTGEAYRQVKRPVFGKFLKIDIEVSRKARAQGFALFYGKGVFVPAAELQREDGRASSYVSPSYGRKGRCSLYFVVPDVVTRFRLVYLSSEVASGKIGK